MGVFSLDVGGTLSQNSFKTFPGPIRSFTVKENYIGSAVSEIPRYRQKKAYYFIE